MNRLTAFLAAIGAVLLMAGTSFAGGIDHGSWQEYTGLTNGTVSADNHLAGVNATNRQGTERGPDKVITLNYELGEITHGTVGENIGSAGSRGGVEEHYGVAPVWSEQEGAAATMAKAYTQTPEMDLYLY